MTRKRQRHNRLRPPPERQPNDPTEEQIKEQCELIRAERMDALAENESAVSREPRMKAYRLGSESENS